jgi:hypothetical protein
MAKHELGLDYFSMPEYKIFLVRIVKETFENPVLKLDEYY